MRVDDVSSIASTFHMRPAECRSRGNNECNYFFRTFKYPAGR
jgi:hypothetical protein